MPAIHAVELKPAAQATMNVQILGGRREHHPARTAPAASGPDQRAVGGGRRPRRNPRANSGDTRGVLFLQVQLRDWETGGRLVSPLERGWVITHVSSEERAMSDLSVQ